MNPLKNLWTGELHERFVRWKCGTSANQQDSSVDGTPEVDPQSREEFAELDQLWEELRLFPVELVIDEMGSKRGKSGGHTARLMQVWRKPGFSKMLVAMAAFLLVGAIVLTRLFGYGDMDTYQTTQGERLLVNLADDSIVHLNSNTRLSIEMSESQREVQLEHGEGLFDVAKDNRRRFVVRTRIGSAEAMGTTFSVQSTGSQFAVTVLEGVVLVSNNITDKSRHISQYVEPGQRVVVSAEGLISTVEIADAESVTSWARSKIVFSGEPLEQAIERINQHSKHHIEIQDARLRKLPVYGVFNAGDTRGFLAALQQSYPLQPISQSRNRTSLVYREPSKNTVAEKESHQ